MTQPEQIEIERHDIETLAEKLDTFFAGLTGEEQAIMSHVLRASAESASEVSGYAAGDLGMGFSPMLATAVQMQDFHFVKKVDKASPKLMLACYTGEHAKPATH